MDIKEVTIRVQTSRQYQVYETTITATNLSGNDIESIKQTAVAQSISGLNLLCNSMGLSNTEQPKVETTVIQPQQQSASKSNDMPEIGSTREFPNKAGTHTTRYKFCYSEKTKEHFWALLDPKAEQYGYSKYIKYTPGM